MQISNLLSPAVLVFMGLSVISCGKSEAAKSNLNLEGGQRYIGCSIAEQARINPAILTLLQSASTEFDSYVSCLKSAEFVENKGVNYLDIASSLKSADLVDIHCRDLEPNILGEAPVDIRGTRLSIDRGFISSGTTARLAGTIGHEIMHNRGFRHSEYPFGSPHYPLTVPEQVEACLQTGTPNLPAPNTCIINNKPYKTGEQFRKSLGCIAPGKESITIIKCLSGGVEEASMTVIPNIVCGGPDF